MPVQINFFQQRLASGVEAEPTGLAILDGDLPLGVSLRRLRLCGKPCFLTSRKARKETRAKTSNAPRSESYLRAWLQHFDGVLQLKRVTFRFYDQNRKMSISRKLLLLIGLTFALAAAISAQKPAATPRQEKLLNGMKVLTLKTLGNDIVSVKLRIHAGSSFDPQEKEGVMKLLSDSFFPTADSRSFFRDELGGSFDVICNYDYIEFDTTARSGDFLTLIETVAQAMATVSIDKDSITPLKAAQLAKVQALEKDPSYVADQAVAARLFGTFPYGRPIDGTTASLQKIDFADLRFAKDRLVTADNATVIISGNIDPNLAFRAARRYFGALQKSDKRVPSTFRQPDAPDAAAVKLEMPGIAQSEIRYATRGFARSSKDFAPAEVFARILQTRLAEVIAQGSGSNASVVHGEHILPGAFTFGYRSQSSSPIVLSTSSDKNADQQSLHSILARPITEAEFSVAKNEVLAERGKREITDLWLDVDTFRIVSPSEDLKAFQNVAIADVNALASGLTNAPLATAVVSAPAVPTANSTAN